MPTVSNTSPISNLACIGRLDLIREQFTEVWVPSRVELKLGNVPDPVARKSIEEAKRAGWLKTKHASDSNLIALLMVQLHSGEAEAIARAVEFKADRLLIDEKEGANPGQLVPDGVEAAGKASVSWESGKPVVTFPIPGVPGAT